MKSGKIKYEFEFVGGNTTVIRRTMPDKSESFVGYIIREMNKPRGAIVYRGYGTDGNEILPPKDKFGEAAVQYENHLREKDEKLKSVAKPGRQIELKNIRKKKQKSRQLQR